MLYPAYVSRCCFFFVDVVETQMITHPGDY